MVVHELEVFVYYTTKAKKILSWSGLGVYKNQVEEPQGRFSWFYGPGEPSPWYPSFSNSHHLQISHAVIE